MLDTRHLATNAFHLSHSLQLLEGADTWQWQTLRGRRLRPGSDGRNHGACSRGARSVGRPLVAAAAGIPVFAWKGETLEDYWDCTYKAITWPDGSGPDQIVDDGGDATMLIHKGLELDNGSDWVNSPSDNEEEGVVKDLLKRLHAENQKPWQSIAD